MPLDYERIAPSQPWIAGRFCLVAFGGGACGFLLWCACDFVYVRFAMSLAWRDVLIPILFPIAVGVAGARFFRQADSPPRVGLAAAAAIVASIVAVGLIVFFGIPFHFAIGGNL